LRAERMWVKVSPGCGSINAADCCGWRGSGGGGGVRLGRAVVSAAGRSGTARGGPLPYEPRGAATGAAVPCLHGDGVAGGAEAGPAAGVGAGSPRPAERYGFSTHEAENRGDTASGPEMRSRRSVGNGQRSRRSETRPRKTYKADVGGSKPSTPTSFPSPEAPPSVRRGASCVAAHMTPASEPARVRRAATISGCR
jgi:hypothetical protein